MGADLICYIAFGPKQIGINDRKANRIARQVRQYLDECISAAEQVLLGKKNISDPRKKQLEAKRSITLHLPVEESIPIPTFASLEELRSHREYQNLVREMLADGSYEVEAEYAFAGTFEVLVNTVREFVAGWNESSFRDVSNRIDPENPRRKVVVAGELSWGDEPTGCGYQMLKKAFGLGIAQRLGVS